MEKYSKQKINLSLLAQIDFFVCFFRIDTQISDKFQNQHLSNIIILLFSKKHLENPTTAVL